MSDNIWQGTTDNYSTVGNWSAGTLPADTEDIFCPRTNSQDMLTNVDSPSGIDVASFNIEKGCTINIGDSTPTALHLSATLLKHEGSGTVYWDHDRAVAETTDEVICQADNRTLALDLRGTGTDDYDRITCNKGKLRLSGGAFTTNGELHVNMVNNIEDAIVEIMAAFNGGSAIPNTNAIVQSAGRLISHLSIGTTVASLGVVVGGGTFEFDTDGTVIQRIVGTGGTILPNTKGTCIVECDMARGLIDLTRSPGAKTITTLVLHSAATLRYNPDIHTITNFIDRGGRVEKV